MKRIFAVILACCLLLAVTALAEQVTDKEITLEFNFGSRTGIYTGEMANDLPNGEGTFSSCNDEKVEWIYTGTWVNGHFEGQGSTAWVDGWREVGHYQGDYLNGEAAIYQDGIIRREGLYVNGSLVSGKLYDRLGNLFFEGAFVDDMRLESPQQQALRLKPFFEEAEEYDYTAVWKEYDKHVGQKFVFAGLVSYVWDIDDKPHFQEFCLDVNNNADDWIDVFGILAVGDQKVVKGDKNVLIYGVLLEKYEWEDGGKKYSAPLVEYMGTERLDFSCKALKLNAKGNEVKDLQTRLKELGYYAGKIDGKYAKSVQTAVQEYQKDKGLPVTGVTSIKTLYLLYKGFGE